ncbi:MAG: HK97 gp10 family phage protein [Oscillospiraceae bacterium]|jgi:hypothetical protein|nr:HK97 gp10 family phage protein [Oscillospiraceae bacterium]
MNTVVINRQNFARFREQLLQAGGECDESARRVVSRMADVGLAETKKNTPVGVYDKEVIFVAKKPRLRIVQFTTSFKKQGGTLRRGWLKSKTRKAGNSWVSGYENSVEYAIYVNNGHRVVNKDKITVGYVKGVRMLEQGMNEARRQAESLFRLEIQRVKNKTGF